MSKYSIDRSSYNFRRYGKPWIARIDFAASAQGKYHFGEFIGSAQDGGTLVIDANEGDIVAQGQKDGRGNNGATTYYQVRNGALVELGGKAEAHKLATAPKTDAPAEPYGLADKSIDDLHALIAAAQAEIARR